MKKIKNTKWFQRLALASCFGLICTVFTSFWWQEWQYLLPTPIPEGYQEVFMGKEIPRDVLLQLSEIKKKSESKQKPIFLHFFSPFCPCSKFNIAHINYLVERYGNEVDFYAVIFNDSEYDIEFIDFSEKYNIPIPTILDKNSNIAASCGVYATPQAAIITSERKLYYKGNYNVSRYCNNRDTNFAEQALGALLEGKNPPDFGELANRAYGCELPENYFK
ncbi:thiol-disulfide isomerase-like thioredoxin [Bernardetia litoralis DSM 6794]|uniref:Thiol-disulfide isomerase-like thioredoxin n=1 Tax=Bernardetia litoralis (strain ATCC 23117 / DSM 6794 / NBRC 15988 / NCIMB 1366 / Fx l1 / Sio-4) TaxID=880071 RepID=I4AIK7_BERLS|nr:redoxin domain-containing protein [Bernardetia litoralis]AFM03792.1 thiol-disulfide isomerase-like thioredoxin [Bernardetia litoralis DSM 6794]